MKIIYVFVAGLVASLLTSSAKADVIFSIDLDTTQAGIQNTRDIATGQSFTAALVMQVTGTSKVAAFSLGLSFDNTELIANAVDTSGRPGGFNQVNPAVINQGSGTIRPFDAISVGAALENFSGNIGLITFTGGANPLTDGQDIIAQFQTGGDDILDGDTFAVIPRASIILNGASINVSAVPEPTTWLFGTVLAGFGAKRLRKRLAAKRCQA